MGQPTVIQINDVDIDSRGLAYASDRVGTGLFILQEPKAELSSMCARALTTGTKAQRLIRI